MFEFVEEAFDEITLFVEEGAGGAVAIMSLACAQAERRRQAIGIDHSMDFGGQPAARTTHAIGSAIIAHVLYLIWPVMPENGQISETERNIATTPEEQIANPPEEPEPAQPVVLDSA